MLGGGRMGEGGGCRGGVGMVEGVWEGAGTSFCPTGQPFTAYHILCVGL